MGQFDTAYWNERAEKHGHTGHSEPFYYCFDQQARIYAVEQLLNELETGKGECLDFGCGSGEFLSLLSKRFKTVTAFDTSRHVLSIARKNQKQPNVFFINDIYGLQGKKIDFLLSVTVLQYFPLSELQSTLGMLNHLLSPGGKAIFMEFFPSKEFLPRSGTMGVSEGEWENCLALNNFKILHRKNFYNPVVRPVTSWRCYKLHPVLLLLKPFKRLTFVRSLYSRVAKKLIHRYQDVLLAEESPLKIYLVEISRKQVMREKT